MPSRRKKPGSRSGDNLHPLRLTDYVKPHDGRLSGKVQHRKQDPQIICPKAAVEGLKGELARFRLED